MRSRLKWRQYLKSSVFWLLVAVSFVAVAIYLVMSAAGYKYNPSAGTIQKTVLLRVKSTPPDAIVYLNGKPFDKKTPIRETGVLPGKYDVKIEKAGYIPWVRFLDARPGLAYDFDKVVLFLQEPQVEVIKGGNLPIFSPDSKLYFIEGEIWYNDKLVTRLSQNIKATAIYPDRAHIAYQVNSEVRIIEMDGKNNTLLVKLESSEPAQFGFQDDDTLIYKDGDMLKRAKIR